MAATVFHLNALRNGSPLAILEIGSWTGSSTLTWCQALQECGCGGSVVCVDPWIPYFDEQHHAKDFYRRMNSALEQDLPYHLFLHNTRGVPPMVRVQPLRGKSSDILPLLRREHFDLVYVDGNHAYDAVLQDLLNSIPLIKPDGILCGDDLELQASECDLVAARKRRDEDYVVDPKAGKNHHPGVTLAVAEVLGEVVNLAGYWLMQRNGPSWNRIVPTGQNLMVPQHFPESIRRELMDALGRTSGEGPTRS